MSIMTKDTMVVENDYIDVQEWLRDLGRAVEDSDFDPSSDAIENLKLDLRTAGQRFVETYNGTNSFARKMKVDLVKKGSLTDRQLRASLEVLRKEIGKGSIVIASRDGRVETPLVSQQGGGSTTMAEAPANPTLVADKLNITSSDYRDHNYTEQCYTCHRWFKSVRQVLDHKPECHIWAPVIQEDGTYLDISNITDGNYAIMKSDRQFHFVQVRTQRRTVKRDRKFRYGKIKSGKEVVLAGTIEVRIQRGDTKELVGEQRPGEGYRGSHVEELMEIVKSPELWATFYAAQKKCCYICGKSLTDDISMSDLIGPDCWKKYGSTYFQTWSRAKALEEAAAGHDHDDEEVD